MKILKYYAFLFAVIITLFLSCSENSTENSLAERYSGKGEGDVVARIGTYELKAGRLNAMYNTLTPPLRKNYEKYGGIERFLVDFSEQKSVVLEMSKSGIVDYEDITVHIERGIDQAMFNQFLEFSAGKNTTEETLEEYYNKNIENFTNPEMVRARHIFTSPERENSISNTYNDDAVGDDKARKKIKKISDLLQQGNSFEDLAKKYSEDISAGKGGDLGFFKRGDMVLSFEEAAFSMEPGEISGVVESSFGYHIIMLIEKKPAKTLSFIEARESILKNISPFSSPENRDVFIREQINKAAESNKIEIFRENIANF